MAPSASSASGSSDMVAMPGVASSGVSLNYSSDDTAFVDARDTEEVSLQAYRSRAPFKADYLERMPRIDASPRGAKMQGPVGAAVRDLEARAREGSATRTVATGSVDSDSF